MPFSGRRTGKRDKVWLFDFDSQVFFRGPARL